MDFLEDKKVQIDMDNKTISAYDCLSVCALKSILPKDGVAKSIVCVSISAQLECKLPFTFITTKSNKRQFYWSLWTIYKVFTTFLRLEQYLSNQMINSYNSDQSNQPRHYTSCWHSSCYCTCSLPVRHPSITRSKRTKQKFVNSISSNSKTDQHHRKIAEDLGFSLENSDLSNQERDKFLKFLGKFYRMTLLSHRHHHGTVQWF